MATVLGNTVGPLDFDTLFASLVRHCPGSELLDDHYVVAALPVSPEQLRRVVPKRLIRIPLAGGAELRGIVVQDGFLLSSRGVVTGESIAPVLAAFGEVSNLRVEVIGVGGYGA